MVTLKEALDEHPTFMVTLKGCPFCIRALDIFDRNRVKCKVYKSERYPILADEIEALQDYHTFPMIYVDCCFIGGCEELEEYFRGREGDGGAKRSPRKTKKAAEEERGAKGKKPPKETEGNAEERIKSLEKEAKKVLRVIKKSAKEARECADEARQAMESARRAAEEAKRAAECARKCPKGP